MTVDRRAVILAALGLIAGFASSFLGIGGGLVIVPVLLGLLGFPLKKAVGTSLATIVLVSLVGVVTEAIVKWDNIHWGMGIALTAGSLLGSWTGGRWLRAIPEAPLRLVYTLFLVVAAWRMFASAQAADSVGWFSVPASPPLSAVIVIITGWLAGLSSVLFGIGGGIIMVPALSLVFEEFTFHAARATSLVTIIPTSAYGAFQHRRMGTADLGVAARMVPFGLLGGVLGVVSVSRIPARPCRMIFAAFLVVAAARLLFMARRPGR